ncbi:DUF6233 domain-containing protein [Streptomyces sp. NPDC050523]|uniref:DUF6233 domain-containing protein n=1 Tax=Streptomyces sp. NPDC050523 TaxID=3365622 RepID=UPI00379875E3
MAGIDAKIHALQQPEGQGARSAHPSAPPDWIVELGIGTGRPPKVHAGDCHMAGKRRRPVNRGEARRLLTGGLRACSYCRPESRPDILDSARRRPLRAARTTDLRRPISCRTGDLHRSPGTGPPP